jgi:hypothetical protein
MNQVELKAVIDWRPVAELRAGSRPVFVTKLTFAVCVSKIDCTWDGYVRAEREAIRTMSRRLSARPSTSQTA